MERLDQGHLHPKLEEVVRTALTSPSTLNIYMRQLQVRVFTVKQDRSRRGHHEVNSILN
jgi:hypothetical protein